MRQELSLRKKRRYRINFLVGLIRVFTLLLVVSLLIIVMKFCFSQANDNTSISIRTLSSTTEASTNADGTSIDINSEYLILVNWDNPVPFQRPDNLTILESIFGDEVILVNGEGSINETAGKAAKQMFLDAQKDGIGTYKISSAYRSIEYQDTLWNARITDNPDYGENPYLNPVKVMPGKFSEHTTGLALDILSENYEIADDGYGETIEGKWLAENAYKYGFIMRYPKNKEHVTGVIYEPWHYRYVGVEAAKAIYESNLTLEEFLNKR